MKKNDVWLDRKNDEYWVKKHDKAAERIIAETLKTIKEDKQGTKRKKSIKKSGK